MLAQHLPKQTRGKVIKKLHPLFMHPNAPLAEFTTSLLVEFAIVLPPASWFFFSFFRFFVYREQELM